MTEPKQRPRQSSAEAASVARSDALMVAIVHAIKAHPACAAEKVAALEAVTAIYSWVGNAPDSTRGPDSAPRAARIHRAADEILDVLHARVPRRAEELAALAAVVAALPWQSEWDLDDWFDLVIRCADTRTKEGK